VNKVSGGTATIALNWDNSKMKTAEEQQVSHFIVERSDYGVDFYPIGKMTARNSGRIENYALALSPGPAMDRT
jgi:hypothetical protein